MSFHVMHQLDQACQDLEAGSRQRAEELSELSQLLRRVKQSSMNSCAQFGPPPTKHAGSDPVESLRGGLQAAPDGGTVPGLAAWGNGALPMPYTRPLDPLQSPGGRAAMPDVVRTGLGALSSANKTLSAFQYELNSGLSQLAHHASEARRTASTVRAHVDLLQNLVSPEKAGAGEASPAEGALGYATAAPSQALGKAASPQVSTPNAEVASLLRVLQEAAEQRALAETSLQSPSPRGLGLLEEEMLRPGGKDVGFLGTADASGRAGAYVGSEGGTHATAPMAAPGVFAGASPSAHRQHRASLDVTQDAGNDQTARAEADAKAHNVAAPAASVRPCIDDTFAFTEAQLADQANQYLLLQTGVKLLEAQRHELLASLEDTSSKVASHTVELEVVRTELQAAKAELDAQTQLLKAAFAKRQSAEQSLHDKLAQLKQLDSLVQASAAQLADLQASITAAGGIPASIAALSPCAAGAGLTSGCGARGQRAKVRAKRHVPIRRTRSCENLMSTPEQQAACQAQLRETAMARGRADTAAELHAAATFASSGRERVTAVVAKATASTPSSPVSGSHATSFSPSDERLATLQRELQLLAEQHSKAMLQLEQERHTSMSQHCEIVALRQKLRAQDASDIAAAAGSGRSPGGGLKRPLSVAMSGLDDLLEEAAADLEQLEGHIATVTHRLVDMQAQSLRLAQQVAAALRSKAEADAEAAGELSRAKALREEADSLQRAIVADKQSSARLAAQLSAAQAELQQLTRQVDGQRATLQQCKDAEQMHVQQAQEAQQRLLHVQHSRDVAEQARRAAEHELSQIRVRLEEAEQRAKQAEQDAAASRDEVEGLASAAKQARQEHTEASEELNRLRKEALAARAELASIVEELAAVRATHAKEQEAARTAEVRREETERAHKACMEELQTAQEHLQQGKAQLADLNNQLSRPRQEQQELTSAAERHEQMAATAERRAAAAQQELEATQEQVAAAQRQLAEVEAQLAALRGAAGARVLGASGFGASTPSMRGTPVSGFGMGPGPFAAPAMEHSGGFTGGPMGHFAAHQQVAAIMQLQAETERLQVAMVQAQSRQRLAEQRAVDAEQMCSELQARINGLRAQQQSFRAELDGPSHGSAVHVWKAKVDELQQELEASQHLTGRYKTRLAAAQDECSSLEESVQRERAAATRLRQQLDALQQELQAARAQQRAANDNLAAQQALQSRAAASGVHAAGARADEQVEQGAQQLHKIQQQVARQQELHSELLEEHTKLRHQGAALRTQLEEAAEQLATLKAHYEKGRRKMEQLKEQESEHQEHVASLIAQEQAARTRLQEVQLQAAERERSCSGLQDSILQAQQQLSALQLEVARAQHSLSQAVAKRDAAIAEACDAERKTHALREGLTAVGVHGASAAEELRAEAAAAQRRLAALEQELQAARHSQAAAEERLAEERRQLRLCQDELAAVRAAHSSSDAATLRLQEDLQQLRAQVASLQLAARKAESVHQAGVQSAMATPVGPGRQLALAPVDPSASPAVEVRTAPRVSPALEATQAELSAARRELHALQLRIAVAGAEEARLTATCAELTRQQAVAEHEVKLRRQQAAEAEQRLASVQVGAPTGGKILEGAAELAALQDKVRSAQQRTHAAEAAEADAKHQAQMAAMKLQYAEEQLRLQEQQAAQQVQALSNRLEDAQAALQRERQRAMELQGRVAQLQEEAAQQAAHALERSTALQAQVRQHAERAAALEAALEQARAQEATASGALEATRREADQFPSEVARLAAQLTELRSDVQQREAESARSAAEQRESLAEAGRLRAQVEQLRLELSGAEASRDVLALQAEQSTAVLEAEQARCRGLQDELQSLESRLLDSQREVERLRAKVCALGAELNAVREERMHAQPTITDAAEAGDRQATLQPKRSCTENNVQVYMSPDAGCTEGLSSKLDAIQKAHIAEISGLHRLLQDQKTELAQLQDEYSRCMAELDALSRDYTASSSAHLERSALQQEALQQLAANCSALQQQRDTALEELGEAASALRAANARVQEVTANNDELQAELTRLQQLALNAMALIGHLQKEQQSTEEQRATGSRPGAAADHAAVPADLGACTCPDARSRENARSPFAHALIGGVGGRARAGPEQAQEHADAVSVRCDQATQAGVDADASSVSSTARVSASDQAVQTFNPLPVASAAGTSCATQTDGCPDWGPVRQCAKARTEACLGGPLPQPQEAELPLGRSAAAGGEPASRSPARPYRNAEDGAFMPLLKAVVDRSSLEDLLRMVQGQLQAALQEKSQLERQVGSLEAQLSQLHCDQERQLVAMHTQIEALREQLGSWSPDQDSAAGGPGQPGSAPQGGVEETPEQCAKPIHSTLTVSAAAADVGDASVPARLTADVAVQVGEGPAGYADEVACLQSRIADLTALLESARRDACAAQSDAADRQREAENLACSLAGSRNSDREARQQLLSISAERDALAAQVAKLQEQLHTRCSAAAKADVAVQTEDGGRAELAVEVAVQTAGAEASPTATQTIWSPPALQHAYTQTDDGSSALYGEQTITRQAEELVSLQEQLRTLSQRHEAELGAVSGERARLQGRLAELQGEVAALQRQHEAELEQHAAEELRRLQSVRQEYTRLEEQLQVEQERAHTAAVHAAEELRECQKALAAAKQQAQDAIQEALRSASQAASFQAQLLALRQQVQLQRQPSAPLPEVRSSAVESLASCGRSRSSADGTGAAVVVQPPTPSAGPTSLANEVPTDTGTSRYARPPTPSCGKTAPAGQPAPKGPAASTADASTSTVEQDDGAVTALKVELLKLKQQCTALERQQVLHQGELQRAQSKVEAAEARYTAAARQVALLTAELKARDEDHAQAQLQREEEIARRVAQQADADARLLCEVREQLRDCQQRLARSEAEAAQARTAAESAQSDLQAARTELAQLEGQRRLDAERLRQRQQREREARHAPGASKGSAEVECASGLSPAGDAVPHGGALLGTLGPGTDTVQATVQRVLAALLGPGAGALVDALADGGSGDSSGSSDEGSGSDDEAALADEWVWAGRLDDHVIAALQQRCLSSGRSRDPAQPQCQHGLPLSRHSQRTASPNRAVSPQCAVCAARAAIRSRSTASQTDVEHVHEPLVPPSRMAAATSRLAEMLQQESALAAAVSALRCQAAEAEATVSARTERVAELRSQEQQLAAAVAALRQQAEDAMWQLEDTMDHCRASSSELRHTLDADCQRLQQLRSRLIADAESSNGLLRDATSALRLARASLQTRHAVDAALAGLTEAAASDAGGGGLQALQHVKVVFGCLTELCGRAEALSATLGPLVTRLEACRREETSPGGAPDACDQANCGSGGDGARAVVAAVSAMPTGGQPAGGLVAGQAANPSEVQKALKRSYLQLHSRARKFARVLQAMAAGEQLPAEVLQEGFQRLWSCTDQQLSGLMRLASEGGAAPPEPELAGPGARPIDGVGAAALLPASHRNTGCGAAGACHAERAVPRDMGAAAAPAGLVARVPLAAVGNLVAHAPQHSRQEHAPANLQLNKRGPPPASAANRRPLASGSIAAQAAAALGSPARGGVSAASRQPQQPQRRQAQSPPLGAATHGSPQVAARQRQVRRQQQQQQQFQQPQQQQLQQPQPQREQHHASKPRAPEEAQRAPGKAAAPAAIEAASEHPGRRRLEARLQQVLSLAKELQSRDRAAPQSGC